VGKDAVISEDKIAAGSKLATKLWNVGMFARRFLLGYRPPDDYPRLSAADAWILSALDALIERCTESMESYDYATAKNDMEMFFWHDLADNYLEMAKGRLYDTEDPLYEGARYALHHVLLTVLKLFAPFLPFVTEAIYREVIADTSSSIHLSQWPHPVAEWRDAQADDAGHALLEIAASVRRYKSDRGISLGAPVPRLVVEAPAAVARSLSESLTDIRSLTRAEAIEVIPGEASQTVVTIPEA
jgi:valyl-tRNA synthetase